MRRPVVVLTLILGGLVAVWGALVLLDLLARSERRTVRPLEVAGELRLETSTGDVEVVASPGPARLELRSVRGLFGGPGTRVARGEGGVLSVETNCSGPLALSCSGSLRVLVPPRTRVRLRTGSGEVTVRGIRGGLVADTGSGDVALRGVGGPRVAVETGSGEIGGTDLTPGRLRADTGSGDVRMTVSSTPDAVDVDTGSGDVVMTVPDVAYRVSSDTGSGENDVVVDSDPAAIRSLRVQTGSGDIDVRPGD